MRKDGRPGSGPLYEDGKIAVGEERRIPLHQTGRIFTQMKYLRKRGERYLVDIEARICRIRRVA